LTVYPLAPLARVRGLREDAAAAELSARERAWLAAKQEILEREQALKDYIAWREEEEERRYAEILHQELSLKELDAFKSGLAALRERDNVLLEAVTLARRAEEDALKARDEAAAALRQARKDKEKISAHKEIWQAFETREAERREDLEMEEFSGKKPVLEED
jgi:type III secretion protein O